MLSTGRNSEVRTQKKVEEALRSKMKAAALKQCDPVVAAFADCARGRTLSVVWSCRSQAREINACLKQYTSDEVLDNFKREYLEAQEQSTSNPPDPPPS